MPLYGREAELKELGVLLDGPANGSGVLIRGEPGAGKSALVAEAVAAASVAGLRVLRTTGVEAEQNLAYSGLHQLLFPVRAGVDSLPRPQRAALRTALGLADAAEPSAYLVGLAALSLLAEQSEGRPLLIVADDVQWLDPASADVLAFVARRIEAEPIVLIATLAHGAPSPLRDAGLSPMTLERLSDEVAAELLDSVAPGLTPTVRARVLAEAAGNPLALTELPSAVTDLDPLDPVLPLTERLERAFAARVAALPARTRAALLVAALNEGGSVAEALAATGSVLGVPAEPEVLTPAVDAGLIEPDPGAVTFRHPLMRSAIPAASTLAERRRAHLALAATLREQPDRRAWHQAAATTGTDEQVAADLERAADRARHRGGVAAAIAALEQAARLSDAPGQRADRLLRAAELAVESGRRETAERLVRQARAGEPSPRRRATASWLLSGFDDGVREDTARTAELAGLAESVAVDGQVEPAMRILWGAAMRCFWSEPGPETRRSLLGVADRLPVPDDDPRMIAIAAYVAPLERGGVVLDRLLDPADPAYQLALRGYFVAELTDAAVRAGQTDAMRDVLRDLETAAASTPSPALHIGLRYARAVLAPHEDAEELFTNALRADLTAWPAERGRVHLAFGEWLRRQRRVVESRSHLRTAREAFDALGMTAWAERARRDR